MNPLSHYVSISTLKETSKDKENNVYMTNSTLPAWNFDNFSDVYLSKKYSRQPIGSADALYCCQDNNDFYLIEFKNGSLNTKTIRKDIKLKILASLFVLLDANVVPDYETCRQHAHFILVYNLEKNKNLLASAQSPKQEKASFSQIAEHYQNKAEHIPVLFDLKKDYEGVVFRSVRTYNAEEFQEEFVSKAP